MSYNKKIRVFAGPNGSGKSTLFKDFTKRYNPHYFINADHLEKQLRDGNPIDFEKIGIIATLDDFDQFNKTKEANSLKENASRKSFSIDLIFDGKSLQSRGQITNSYEAQYAAAFIRWVHYRQNLSFSYETVMSHPSKVKELEAAKEAGYKVYLYFICTEDPNINVQRVDDRVHKNGHFVDTATIVSRYPKTLQNFYPAMKNSWRSYFFDNSGKEYVLIAESFKGEISIYEDAENLPLWFTQYILPYCI